MNGSIDMSILAVDLGFGVILGPKFAILIRLGQNYNNKNRILTHRLGAKKVQTKSLCGTPHTYSVSE